MGKKAVLLLTIAVLLPATAFAGAWTTEQFHSWHKLSVNYFASDEVWNDDGEIEKVQSDFQDWNVAYYGQLGLTGYLDIWTSFAYKHMTSEDDERIITNKGLGDVDIALKGRFLEKPLVMSTQFVFTMPWAYDRDAELPLGDGFADYELKLLIGRSLYPAPMYIGAEGGYKIREGFQPNIWTYLVEAGINVWKLYARVKLDGWSSAEGFDPPEENIGRSVSIDSNLGKLDSTLGVQIIKYIGLEASYIHQLWGRNTGRGYTLSAGITGSF